MNSYEKQFHIQQRRLRRQGGKPQGVKAESVVRPLFCPELTDAQDSLTNNQRIEAYMKKWGLNGRSVA